MARTQAEFGASSSSSELYGIELLWLPLGARATGVARLSGKVFEWVMARRERRRPLELYHSALELSLPEGHWVIETAGLVHDDGRVSRGVVLEGPLFLHRLGRHRLFRYELRRWRDGVIADAEDAVESPRRVGGEAEARRLLGLAASVPMPLWGRDELRTGEMWNSNSVVAWLLAASGVPMEDIHPPRGGRAPGWNAGLVAARRQLHEQHAQSAGMDVANEKASAPGKELVA